MAKLAVQMTDSTMARFPALAEDWNYQWGLVLKGVEQVWRATGEQKYFAYIQANLDRFVQPDGTIRGYRLEEYNVDRLNTGKALFPLYEKTGDAKYKRALDLLHSQLATHPRTPSNGLWHKQIYPNQMWLDGIYMADAFSAQYVATFQQDPKTFDDIAHQIILIEQKTRDEKTGLLYHAWDESKQQKWADPVTGRSPHFWGRAMGWYGMAIADVLDYMPHEHAQRNTLIAILQRTLDAVLRVQDQKTGVWYQVLDQGARTGNYLESSASCMFVYALAKASRKNYLPAQYAQAARRAYEGVLAQFVTTKADGTVNLHFTCQSAGLGGSPYRDASYEYYVSEPIITNNHHGVGAFILAASEIEKL